MLQKTDSAIHTPLLLALMVLKYVSSKEEDVEVRVSEWVCG